MNIGIDFDNTIVKYDNLFKEVAITEGYIKKNWNGNGKINLRNHLRSKPDGAAIRLSGHIFSRLFSSTNETEGAEPCLRQMITLERS